jgi:putative membrane protein
MMFFGLLAFIFIIWFLFKDEDVLKRLKGSDNEKEDVKSKALKILNEKFVNGEISEEEYLKRKRLIEQ